VACVGAHTNSFNRNGVFVGGGLEITEQSRESSGPLFMKTEYRAAYSVAERHRVRDGTNLPLVTTSLQAWGQTIRHLGLPLQTGWPPIVSKY